jgi:hypothetical protein
MIPILSSPRCFSATKTPALNDQQPETVGLCCWKARCAKVAWSPGYYAISRYPFTKGEKTFATIDMHPSEAIQTERKRPECSMRASTSTLVSDISVRFVLLTQK